MRTQQYLIFNRPYEDKAANKSFAAGVKYTISEDDLSFYTVHGCKISKFKEGDLFEIGMIHTNTYRD